MIESFVGRKINFFMIFRSKLKIKLFNENSKNYIFSYLFVILTIFKSHFLKKIYSTYYYINQSVTLANIYYF
jgi:hypothetical protein